MPSRTVIAREESAPWHPPPKCPCLILKASECDLIWGEKVFADVSKDFEMRSFWVRWVAINPITVSLQDTHREEEEVM